MTADTMPTDRLVEALAHRLRRIDLLAWQRIARWAEQHELSFQDLRLLLAFSLKIDDGPTPVRELGDLAGFSIDASFAAVHSLRHRGYVREEKRRYSLSQTGQELVAKLDEAHRAGIQTYVETLAREERDRLVEAFASDDRS